MNDIIQVKGKEGIQVKVLADSISSVTDKRITTFEVDVPRFIWAEVLTHRLFSRNAASSRAIPIKKKRQMVLKDPAMPVFWGRNQKGMQAKEELEGRQLKVAKRVWIYASKVACGLSWALEKTKLHKQLANRVIEPFERFKGIISATEFENWLWLRDHEDAQPEIAEMAKLMRQSLELSTPFDLSPGEYHLPYIETKRVDIGQHGGGSIKYVVNGERVDLNTAIQISASCCAQVSYRVLDTSIEKATKIYGLLVDADPFHASPFEHQATPMRKADNWKDVKGITHVDKNDKLWSGNFCGWIQNRQLMFLG